MWRAKALREALEDVETMAEIDAAVEVARTSLSVDDHNASVMAQ